MTVSLCMHNNYNSYELQFIAILENVSVLRVRNLDPADKRAHEYTLPWVGRQTTTGYGAR